MGKPEYINNSEINNTGEDLYWKKELIKLRKNLTENKSIKKGNNRLGQTAKNNFNVYYNTGFERSLIEGSSALLDMISFNEGDFSFQDIKNFIFQGHDREYIDEDKGDLSKEGIFKLNNIIRTTVQYCKEEGLDNLRFIKRYEELKQDCNIHLHETIRGNATLSTKDGKEELSNSNRGKKQFGFPITTLNQLEQLFKITGEYGNREAFFYRTMFIAAQLENSKIYKNKEQHYHNTEKELTDFQHTIETKGIKISLIGNTKSDSSTITKISKDPEYSHINQLKDIIRFTYVIGDNKNPEEDIKQCLQVFAQFYKDYKDNTDKNIKITEIKNKFGTLFDTNEQGKYNYIDEKTQKGVIINGIELPIPESKKKSTSGETYKDLKMIVEFAGVPCEIKFITPQRDENNNKGMSNHDLMRLTENINKTARKYGFISRKYIEKRVEKERPKKDKKDVDGITQETYINNILEEHYREITPPNGEGKKNKDTYYVNNKRLKRRNTLLRDSNTEEQDYLTILQNIIYEPKVEDIRKDTGKELAEALIS